MLTLAQSFSGRCPSLIPPADPFLQGRFSWLATA
jgi:hypothetical protein